MLMRNQMQELPVIENPNDRRHMRQSIGAVLVGATLDTVVAADATRLNSKEVGVGLAIGTLLAIGGALNAWRIERSALPNSTPSQ
jgi:hypothetical protein